jgi:hypothetical protein
VDRFLQILCARLSRYKKGLNSQFNPIENDYFSHETSKQIFLNNFWYTCVCYLKKMISQWFVSNGFRNYLTDFDEIWSRNRLDLLKRHRLSMDVFMLNEHV